MKLQSILIMVLLILIAGCSGNKNPLEPPGIKTGYPSLTAAHGYPEDGNKKLWSYGFIHVNDDHSQWDYVPVRQLDFHFNAVKFLEQGPCQNCISVEKVVHLPDGVMDVDVRIQHPFPGMLQYTGFDVKGIVMFPGTVLLKVKSPYEGFNGNYSYRFFNIHPECYPMYFNRAFHGDWELLNPDGYSLRWTPAYLSGSDALMFKYIKGKYASDQIPNSGINGFKNFYTHEERHMFYPGQAVTRTYRIQTQPGPMIIGYAVEASWEPPNIIPVTNPLADFPITANQSEPYVERYFVNNGEPITKPKSEQSEYIRFVEWRYWDEGYTINEWGKEIPNVNNILNGHSSSYPQLYQQGKWSYPSDVSIDRTKWTHPVQDVEGLYYKGWMDNFGLHIEKFLVSGKFNGYYIFVRISFHSLEPELMDKPWTNWNPSIEVVHVNIPGNEY